MVKKLLEIFTKKNCKKEINKYSEQKKYLKEKVVNCMSNRKDVIVVVRVGLIKKDLIKKTFPKPFRSFGGIINVKIDLSNYATKIDLKNAAHVDTSSFSLKSNLASLKAEVNKLALTN